MGEKILEMALRLEKLTNFYGADKVLPTFVGVLEA
jgi:hypothetical protein